jgi:hypothetical protein
MMRKQLRLWAFLAVGMFALQPIARSIDGAILVVSAADWPMPAPTLERKIKQALDKADIRYSSAQLASLSEQAAEVMARPGGPIKSNICASDQSPCITLIRE